MKEGDRLKGGKGISSISPELKASPELKSASAKQPPRYWVRLMVFLIPLIISELMFLRVGKVWEVIIFPIAWVGFFYFQMKRGGWNIFKP